MDKPIKNIFKKSCSCMCHRDGDDCCNKCVDKPSTQKVKGSGPETFTQADRQKESWEAGEFEAYNIVNQILDEVGTSVEVRQRINDKCDAFAKKLISQAITADRERLVERLENSDEVISDEYGVGFIKLEDAISIIKEKDYRITKSDPVAPCVSPSGFARRDQD